MHRISQLGSLVWSQGVSRGLSGDLREGRLGTTGQGGSFRGQRPGLPRLTGHPGGLPPLPGGHGGLAPSTPRTRRPLGGWPGAIRGRPDDGTPARGRNQHNLSPNQWREPAGLALARPGDRNCLSSRPLETLPSPDARHNEALIVCRPGSSGSGCWGRQRQLEPPCPPPHLPSDEPPCSLMPLPALLLPECLPHAPLRRNMLLPEATQDSGRNTRSPSRRD